MAAAPGDPQRTGKVTPSNPAPSPLAAQIGYGGPSLGVRDNPGTEAYPNQTPGTTLGNNPTPNPPPPSAAASTDWTSDPIYQLAMGQNELAVANAKSAALVSQTQALIAYGDANLALAVTGDQNVAAAAAANKGSTLAQLAAQNAATVRDTNETENQSNLWYSSDRGYKLGLNQQTYLNNASGALSGVQNQLGSISSNLLAQEQGAYANEAQAASEAYNRAVANPVGLPASTPPPATSTTAAKTTTAGGVIPPVAAGATAPKTATAPYATSTLANKTGGSANKTQGVFAVH